MIKHRKWLKVRMSKQEGKFGFFTTKYDFSWTYTDQPHKSRREEILQKYPQVKELYGVDPTPCIQISISVILQFITAYYMQDAPIWLLLVLAYWWGGTINHSLSLAIHEICHNLMFKTPIYNTILGFFANLPIPVPYYVTFKKYHMLHHRYLNQYNGDPDVPMKFEAAFFSNSLLKLLFLILQPFLYTLRPVFFQPIPISLPEIANWIVQLTVDALVVYFMGYQALLYLFLSSLLGASLHPLAGHYVAEHYEWKEGQDTYSYYGPLNYITYNVGYHNEHHDFPQIPASKLPLLRKIAPEYYDTLYYHTSWLKVMWRFVTDSSMSPFSRVVRERKDKVLKVD